MKPVKLNRMFAVLTSVLLICASVPAQYHLGTRRMVFRETPTLMNRSRLSVALGPRPRIGFVGRVGGIASDGKAVPEQGVIINTIVPNYLASRADGQRLSVTINGQEVAAQIYDWQLIPIAKFANSDSFSCFTLFGDNSLVTENVAAYHPEFKNTLMGLRLFQLDSLIEEEEATDLVKDGDIYILGAGELAPNISENIKGLTAFWEFKRDNRSLFPYDSYIISDYRRTITFGIDGNTLSLRGEPYVYFWKMDPNSHYKFSWGEAKETVRKSLGSVTRYTQPDLTNQILREAKKYDDVTERNGFMDSYLKQELAALVRVAPDDRADLLTAKSRAELFDLLVDLRAFNSLDWTIEMRELSDKVSNQTAMLRAINPAVWDTGVNLIRYAAFFRYCKEQKPQQWQEFMRQINLAPTPKPPVRTPSGLEW